MAKIKRLNENAEVSYTIEEIKDICKKYNTLKTELLPVAINKWNAETKARWESRADLIMEPSDCMIDWVEDFGDRGIGVEFLDQDGNDYNITLTKEDLA